MAKPSGQPLEHLRHWKQREILSAPAFCTKFWKAESGVIEVPLGFVTDCLVILNFATTQPRVSSLTLLSFHRNLR